MPEVEPALPKALLAVTTTRSIVPVSVLASLYVELVAPLMFVHVLPRLDECCHW